MDGRTDGQKIDRQTDKETRTGRETKRKTKLRKSEMEGVNGREVHRERERWVGEESEGERETEGGRET